MSLQINCKSCGAQIHADDINLERTLAKCLSCHAVFDFSAQLEEVRTSRTGARRRQRPEVPLPGGLSVDRVGDHLVVVRRWFTPIFFFLLLFCIAWDGFLIFWYSMAFQEDAPLIMSIFPIAHLAVGVGLTYFVIAGFLNTTTLRVEDGQLTVRHAPFPWPGNRLLDSHEIEQLYCQEKTQYGRRGSVSRKYSLNAITRENRKIKLLSGLEDPDQALFVEQIVEEHLGIEDRTVGGEYSG